MDCLGYEELSDEDFECETPRFNLYFFAEDVSRNKDPCYHIALFKRYFVERDNEVFISLDDFRKKPIITLRGLNFLLEDIFRKYKGFGDFDYINEVPDLFKKNKNYRPLYDFEKWDVIP